MHMRFLFLLAILVRGGLSKRDCDEKGMRCHWEGTSPICGSTDKSLGDTEVRDDGTYVLQEWSKDYNRLTLWNKNLVGYDCIRQGAYGESCYLGGYKRLWCKVKDPNPETSNDSEPLTGKPKAYTGWAFDGSDQALELDDQCKSLPSSLSHNVGSLDIPCSLHNRTHSAICSLYSDPKCATEIITYDRSHYSLFANRQGETYGDIGSRVRSIKCQVRANTDLWTSHVRSVDHPSNESVGQCPNEKCSSFCTGEPQSGGLYCSDYATCKKALSLGDACTKQQECGVNVCQNNTCQQASSSLGWYGYK